MFHPPLLFTLSRHFLRRHHHRHLSTLSHTLSHPIYTIWSANTGLGKTLVSAGIAAASVASPPSKLVYIKPIQTGYPLDSDAAFVYRKIPQILHRRNPNLTLTASNQTLNVSIPAAKVKIGDNFSDSRNGFGEFGFCEEMKVGEGVGEGSELICKTIYAWNEAISPHLASEREGALVGDEEVLVLLKKCLEIGVGSEGQGSVLSLVETAGGVASPGSSGSLQCDLYRPFRLPSILVGDGKLGGISGTISAYESLTIRGYDVVAIVLEDHGLENEVPLLSYLRNRVPVLVLPSIPKDPLDNLMEWYDESQSVFDSLKGIMLSSYEKQMYRLHEMPKKAQEIFWWPFTQHKLVPQEKVTVIDSRCGENFAVHKVKDHDYITQMFDACASWWTQGPNAALQIKLAREMGYTAARYGHVMFPENVYEPALQCAELLLQGVGKGWASRVFFSDNGSTAIEIALKMAFRKFLADNKLLMDLPHYNTDESNIELKVVALNGSYHGDTLGAMDAQAPSPYTGFLQQPWYTGRGVFLDPPFVSMCDGVWKIAVPKKMHYEDVILEDTSFNSRDQVFNRSRDDSKLASIYSTYISQELLPSSGSTKCSYAGALIIEPVIQGAGGMLMVDPLFQRILVKECKNRKIPVIFDEVFTGYWRLGVESAAELLFCQPDIACFAKLMTGGMIPLAATLATNDVFESFVGDSKLNALLHGHSYSAHAVGCATACNSIKWFKDSQTNPNLVPGQNLLRELWDAELVRKISFHPAVQRVVSLGTLFALELKVEDNDAGYASLSGTSLLLKLREDGIYMRPLGNVIYMMCGPCTSHRVCLQMLEKLYMRLDEFKQEKIGTARDYDHDHRLPIA
ncbi:putative dethiobiotin synthase, Adenosylmethionine--8-amino-7-oxononanoate transaminase [Helianthus annuus]|uniref:Dethiobiotin synthase, Adenosylmethionine--8-amino-7-oxononanoate transaminase n=1 Tax=Helianthus annuus TaxID=4232 RepID=A0A251V892_HELAN|nr:bifunctional dethiobiotin synthetase/7,8-diamino-pelargonic acid aminotransferase, mitochondrial [Helianthus annuus]KAF5813245.1 putative dethiobiotin synthase, Adenosylmethionine--8-amino-7-oxononanoate transaminase [Helianthus annuus]KAJ0599431.1 putative dethiobiotin synthase, Adenosylmethionine--8-amino-7-oxononanoate transaminase [Helianthus annuus]KAJ0607011.1 putative dethiobiotin synthase, Adenosylmethionine--8-amino-7-oxononanoate transaminase [Helianthus annuus]KAJ0934409.1 putativ